MIPGDLLRCLDPVATAEAAGIEPFAWQGRALTTPGNAIWACGRQVGKSTAAALVAIHQSVYQPGSLTVLLSPSQRQSSYLLSRVAALYRTFGRPVSLDSDTTAAIAMGNGSKVISLPGASEVSVRGFSADLLIVDEAARLEEATWIAARPIVATGGRVLLLSTPAGRRGFMWELWDSGDPAWSRFTVKTEEVPTVSAAFLAQERRELGERFYLAEYEAAWSDTAGGRLFDTEQLMTLFNPAFEAWQVEETP